MESLRQRMAESAAIDDSLSSAARELHEVAVAASKAALPSTPLRSALSELGLGESASSPERASAGLRGADPPLSPHARSIAALSAARRQQPPHGGATPLPSALLPPRIPSVGAAARSTAAAAAADAFGSQSSHAVWRSESAGPLPVGSAASLDTAVAAAARGLTPSRSFASSAAASSSRLPRPSAAASSAAPRRAPDGRADEGAASPAAADDEAAVTAALPRDVQLNLLRSQLRMAQKELVETHRASGELTRALAEAQETAASVSEERTKLQRAVAAADAALGKAKRAAAGAEARELEMRTQLAAVQRDVAASARAAKGAETSTSGLEVRLARALEDGERWKAEAIALRGAAADAERSHRAAIAAMATQVKRAERAKEEILGGFLKQLKLIDVLKRQRIHLEAARSLAFTEEEFTKALDAAPA